MSVTKEQLSTIAQQMFDQIDANKNGSLEKSEVRTFSEQMMKNLKPDAEFDEARFEENFATLDKNEDGKVSFEELLKSLIDKAEKNGVLAASAEDEAEE